MIDDFSGPTWAASHERFAAEVVAGVSRLGRWLRRRTNTNRETPVVASKPSEVPRSRTRKTSLDARRNSGQAAAPLAIAAEAAVSADAQYCLREYFRELQERFDGGFDPALSLLPSLDEFASPRGTFLLVRLNGQPVGCGGLKPISKEAAYLKRMWIAPGLRGFGLSRRLLLALEDEARGMG